MRQVLNEIPERPRGVDAFEVIPRLEESLPARLPLTAGEGPELVEAPSDRGYKPLLTFQVGRNEDVFRSLFLARSVRPAESLDGSVGSPPRLQEVVTAKALILDPEVGMVGASSTPGVGEDEDVLLVVGKRLGVGMYKMVASHDQFRVMLEEEPI